MVAAAGSSSCLGLALFVAAAAVAAAAAATGSATQQNNSMDGGGGSPPPPISDKSWLKYLTVISDWISVHDLPSDNLTHSADWPEGELSDSIFINGNLARILLATAALTGNQSYSTTALRWCDQLCSQQTQAETPTGKMGGYWGVGYGGIGPGKLGSVYFGDTGTAVTTLAMCARHPTTDSPRRAKFVQSMQRYQLFVREGCKAGLVGRGNASLDGWLIKQGPDRGAVGCGYYGGHLSTKPYVIATATTGGAFFAELSNVAAVAGTVPVNSSASLAADATAAMKWIASVVLPSGEIPYILDGLPPDTKKWPLDTIAYVTEGVVGLSLFVPSSRPMLIKGFASTIDWLLKNQNNNGSWGALRSSDQQRSARVLTLLSWWLQQGEPANSHAVKNAIQKYLGFLWHDSQHPSAVDYGVAGFSPKVSLHTSSFVGLAVADAINFGITFKTDDDDSVLTPMTRSPPQPEVTAIFTAGEKNVHGLPVVGYRIPGFLAVPSNQSAASSGSSGADWLLVFAEARKYSCSDESPHDLVGKRSSSGGKSWSANRMIVEPGVVWGAAEGGRHGGAVYDPTPLWDADTRTVHLFFSYCPSRYMSRPKIPQAFEFWQVTSTDLGLSWGAPTNLSAVPTPSNEGPWCQRTSGGGGNGIQLQQGPHRGRLIVPGYHNHCPTAPKPPPSPSPPPRPPSCTRAKGQELADHWCNTSSACARDTKPGVCTPHWLARRSEGCCTRPECLGSCTVDWRCYSTDCLTANHSGYRPGAKCRYYCTEGQTLQKIVETCELPPPPPAPAASARSYSHVMYSDSHGAPGSWKYSDSFQPGGAEGSLVEVRSLHAHAWWCCCSHSNWMV
jgi:hypothetical protein